MNYYFFNFQPYNYIDESYHVRIPAGETNMSFNITITDDNIIDGDKIFHLDIYEDSLAGYVHIGSINSTTVTIVDNESKCVHSYVSMYIHM